MPLRDGYRVPRPKISVSPGWAGRLLPDSAPRHAAPRARPFEAPQRQQLSARNRCALHGDGGRIDYSQRPSPLRNVAEPKAVISRQAGRF